MQQPDLNAEPAGSTPTEFERAYGAGFATDHHPALTHFPPWTGTVGPGWDANFLGVKTRVAYFSLFERLADYSKERELHTSPPVQNEDYFEWIDLLEAVWGAKGRFRMIELGAGWGKWIGAGAVAARLAGIDAFLIGVEAEPKHFRWMREHLVDNGVKLRNTKLVRGAVAAERGKVLFHTGDAADWYGQKVETAPPEESKNWRDRLTELTTRGASDERRLVKVRAITLASLLKSKDVVDLIDSDVQGAEADVFEAAGKRLNEVVRRVHIGTHSDENEERLRVLFNGLGWECRNDYPNGRQNETPYGVIPFEDGVQTWINPQL